MKHTAILLATTAAMVTFGSVAAVGAEAADHRPETWFHVIGGNFSKAGVTADLEAVKAAGYGGIQFFHGQVGRASAWPGTTEQIPCLSARWDEMVRFVADECARLGLSFRMQNCPGWSMSGGPWITPDRAMRTIAHSKANVSGGRVPSLPIPETMRDAESDWHDIATLAFPTPAGDGTGELIPFDTDENSDGVTLKFLKPVTARTVVLRSPVDIDHDTCYNPDTHVTVEALNTPSGRKVVRDFEYPQGCWQDWGVNFSVALDTATASAWRVRVKSPHRLKLGKVRLFAGAVTDNFEGKAAWTLRGEMESPTPPRSADECVPAGSVREVRPGETLPEGNWTILRIGHVNMKKTNGPAPKEATGWECDKLDPRGIEANFSAYIGRLAKGPLAGGRLKGMIVDSWECERQTWTWRMEEYFKSETGVDLRMHLPQILGWIVGSPEATDEFLTLWRRTVGCLVTRNYYRRMAELAHDAGIDVAYETSFGDVIPGDILEYWKYCDTPMCEFWQPYAPVGVGCPNFKPVKPCVSAAHLYGSRRVAAEAFTCTRLSWKENFRDLKEQAIRHYARGVTHLVTHTYTHNPQVGFKKPGTSFGTRIGTPFIRGQTWWDYMPHLTRWIAECGEFLERGLPVVDVLRYLGDDAGHKPDELAPFPDGYKCDYLNQDVLLNRLTVRDGRFALPDGMTYSLVWIPDGTRLLPETEKRLAELAAMGGRVVRGKLRDLPPPQIACDDFRNLLWYHRRDGANDLYFVAAETNGFVGTVTFSTQRGNVRKMLRLGPTETRLLTFGKDSPEGETSDGSRLAYPVALSPWHLRFPAGWGAPETIELEQLVPWKGLPGVSNEGRSFSGTATYETTFTVGDGDRADSIDLGEVRDFARVYVNGKLVGTLWAKPYRYEIGGAVRPGTNTLRVEVTSTWYNRLAYDFNQPEERRKTWTVWNIPECPPPCLKPNAALLPSGLLGPITFLTERKNNK